MPSKARFICSCFGTGAFSARQANGRPARAAITGSKAGSRKLCLADTLRVDRHRAPQRTEGSQRERGRSTKRRTVNAVRVHTALANFGEHYEQTRTSSGSHSRRTEQPWKTFFIRSRPTPGGSFWKAWNQRQTRRDRSARQGAGLSSLAVSGSENGETLHTTSGAIRRKLDHLPFDAESQPLSTVKRVGWRAALTRRPFENRTAGYQAFSPCRRGCPVCRCPEIPRPRSVALRVGRRCA